MHKKPTFTQALLPLFALIITTFFSISFWDTGMQIPLIVGITVACLLAKYLGFSWSELEEHMVSGVKLIIPVVFILFLIGCLVGAWVVSGVIPTLIYYGLDLLNPSIFVPTVALITGILTIVLGNSLTALATIGVAFMAVGHGLGFPGPLVAGAIISGAVMGDKITPLSDTTVTAPAIVDTDLFSHIKHMMWDTIPAFLIALILFWIVGNQYAGDASDIGRIDSILSSLQQQFNIHPLLLALPILTVIFMMKKLPVIPTLVMLSALGGIAAFIFQGSNLAEVVEVMTSGFSVNTGQELMDSLLSQGGITSMTGIVIIVVLATALGGLFDGVGLFDSLVSSMLERANSTGKLMLTTASSSFLVAAASGALYLAIILPGQALVGNFKERGLDTKNLSRCLEACGTVGTFLIPWGVPAVFAASVLGVSAYQFVPFIFFAFLVPIINVIYGFTGISIAKKDYSGTIKVKPVDYENSQKDAVMTNTN
ncbi:Na+/H+ antiporter NhaC [Lentibacillus halophilus]|uniref:Na+/H+ antiporter NhaC n=1 Tax=Lentibacillus halophilus TaxID=295065 RepID=A0ABN0Z9I8_9BACI